MKLGPTRTMSTAAVAMIVGLNPALQKRLVLQEPLQAGAVHRVAQVQMGIGGKGQDVAVALTCLKYCCCGVHDGTPTVVDENDNNNASLPSFSLMQFLGAGASGDALLDQLRQQQQQPFLDNNDQKNNGSTLTTSTTSTFDESWTIRTASPLRTCTSLVTPTATTELVEPSGEIVESEWQQLWQRLDEYKAAAVATADDAQEQQSSWIPALCFMGSLPPGCPTDMYAQIYQRLCGGGGGGNGNGQSTSSTVASPRLLSSSQSLVLVDSMAGLPQLLQAVQTQNAAPAPATESASSSKSAAGAAAATAANAKPTVLLKINVEELCQLAQIMEKNKNSDENAHHDNNDRTATVVQALTQFLQAYPAAVAALTAVCITDGAAQTHVALLLGSSLSSSSTNTDKNEDDDDDNNNNDDGEFQLFAIPVAKLESTDDDSPPLYPIGAGDAVAAGTMAAWHALQDVHNHKDAYEDNADRPRRRVLPQSLDSFWKGDKATSQSSSAPSIGRDILTAVSFGLAAGSASCLQPENSVIDLEQLISLYTQTARPALVSSHKISATT